MLSLLSWNVNGIRSAAQKGFFVWLEQTGPDILCLQESRAHPGMLAPSFIEPPGYTSFWHPAKKPGYSGVTTYVKRGVEVHDIANMGIVEYDDEGRVQVLEFKEFYLINAYYPNSQSSLARVPYKVAFCDAMLCLTQRLRDTGKGVIVCGDYNIAHKEIDLAHPKQNVNSPGYLPEERACMDAFIDAGFVDAFRAFTPDPGHYTWWSFRANARKKNVGWRIDYHCVNKEFMPTVREAFILRDVLGSDHCPVGLTLRNGATG
jgi:exodeoxyribonuclease-3